MLVSLSGATCKINIDDCATNPCRNGGTCVDGVNSFTCTCPDGFHDSMCLSQRDECASNPCIHGNCQHQANAYVFLSQTHQKYIIV